MESSRSALKPFEMQSGFKVFVVSNIHRSQTEISNTQLHLTKSRNQMNVECETVRAAVRLMRRRYRRAAKHRQN